MPDADRGIAELRAFRRSLRQCLSPWGDALFELGDAALCSAAPVGSVPSLSLGLGIPEAPYLGNEDGVMDKNPSSKRYPPELKERAVRMVGELRRADPNDQGVISRVARQLGVGT
jgi:hypothetical protein